MWWNFIDRWGLWLILRELKGCFGIPIDFAGEILEIEKLRKPKIGKNRIGKF
jgi:hypothetical protein